MAIVRSKASSKDVQLSFYQQHSSMYEMIIPNAYIDWQKKEMDLLCLRKSGYIEEIEIKLTKSDFKADFKKTVHIYIDDNSVSNKRTLKRRKTVPKHGALKDGLCHCNRFSFLVPEDIADSIEVPEHSGLYTFNRSSGSVGWINKQKEAPLLHKRKIEQAVLYNLGRKMHYRYWNLLINAEQKELNLGF